MSNKAIVLLSGGLDSSVSAYIAKNDGFDIHAITFDYGQQHRRELQAAKDIASSINAVEHIIFYLPIDQFGGSSLLKNTKDIIPQKEEVSTIGRTIPNTYVPARNTIFLSIALSYAETRKASSIFIGVTSADYSGYPDCRPEYIEAFQTLSNIATKRAVLGYTIQLRTPLLHLTKKEIIQKGHTLSVPFEKTWSCYKGEKKACGRCESCLLRLKGFKDANISDPLSYQTIPLWYTIKK